MNNQDKQIVTGAIRLRMEGWMVTLVTCEIGVLVHVDGSSGVTLPESVRGGGVPSL